MEDLLTLPRLEGVDYLEVSWKPEMAEKEIIPIKYHQYYKIWNLVIVAAGFRDGLRPTSMRVGAGARIGEFLCTARVLNTYGFGRGTGRATPQLCSIKHNSSI